MAPLISVVIPTCGRPESLNCCLDRLAPGIQSLAADRYEVVVSDDGDPTVERQLAERYPWARWGLGPRLGPAANRNAGARMVRGNWIAFIDDDCVPSSDWLLAYSDAIRSDTSVYEGKTTCEAGLQTAFWHAPVNLTGGVLWSCNFLIDRNVFEQLQGFDENYSYPHLEDVDLRDRLNRAGYHSTFVPEAVVDHPPRRLPSARKLARYHESDVYHWYKRGARRLVSGRLIYGIARCRLGAIRRSGLSHSTLPCVGSLVAELTETAIRLPQWEWKYRQRFLPRPSR